MQFYFKRIYTFSLDSVVKLLTQNVDLMMFFLLLSSNLLFKIPAVVTVVPYYRSSNYNFDHHIRAIFYKYTVYLLYFTY